MSFYSLHRFLRNLKSKSLGNISVLSMRLNTPKNFHKKSQFGGIDFANFLVPKNSLKLKKSMSFNSLHRFFKNLKPKSLRIIRGFHASHDIPTFFAKIFNFGISLLVIFTTQNSNFLITSRHFITLRFVKYIFLLKVLITFFWNYIYFSTSFFTTKIP